MIRPSLRNGFLPTALILGGLLGSALTAGAEIYYLGPVPKPPQGDYVQDSVVAITVRPLAPGVYAAKVDYVWTGWVELPDGILMVDAAMDERAAMALADTVRARSGDRPFRYLVNTHPHIDHAGGARYFASLGATIVVKDSVAGELSTMVRTAPIAGEDALARSGKKPVIKRIARRLDLGDPKRRPVQVLWMGRPAHTAGDLVVYLPKQKILFAGDLIWNRSVPWMMDPGLSVKGWLTTLDSLFTKSGIDSLVPGHGLMTTPREEIQFTHHYITDAREKAAKVSEWNLPLRQVREWGYLGAYQGMEFYEEIHFMNIRRLYQEARGVKTPGRKNTGVVKKS